GEGALTVAFEQIKQRLAAEGLFNEELKRPIPPYPRTVGIVTSPTGAAVHDILTVLDRRARSVNIVIIPTLVQGELAGGQIAEAIRLANEYCDGCLEGAGIDVLIVGRGGGSSEDLWAFNEEQVARAIRASKIPVISAVGHEVDFTIADMVADLRAPTPSAAAEIVVRAKSEICGQIDNGVRRVRNIIESRVSNYRHELRHLTSSDRLGIVPRRIALQRERLERRRVALYRLLEARARLLRRRLESADQPLARYPRRVEIERHRLEAMAGKLSAVSPLSVLSRGYAIAFSRVRNKRKPIMDSSGVHAGDHIEVQLKKGALACTVDGKTLGIESVWPEVKGDR
ncbi:MAG: exodeoxyribonuclease VII large subunit, partial [Thermoanaerobaculia bacterium]